MWLSAAENTVPIAVILLTDLAVTVMSKEQMAREKLYLTTMSIARRMLRNSLISKEEYAVIDTKMKEKYQPTFGTLFADIDLL